MSAGSSRDESASPGQNLALVALAAAVVAAVVACAWFARAHWGGIYDDALIYLRYVKNLRAGCGLRFNCHGPAVEGFTSPLFLALLTAGSVVTTQLIDLCQIICTASLIVAISLGCCVANGLARRAIVGARVAVILATVGALVVDDFVLLNTVNGMETALGAVAVGAIAVAVIYRRPWGLTAVASIALLVRPETLVFALALPVIPWMRRPRYLVTVAAAFAAITAVRYGVFEAVAPNTYYAKSGGTWRHVELGAAYLRDAVADFPLIVLAPLALLGERRSEVRYLLIGAGGWCAFFLRSGGDTFEYSRLMFPLVPVLTAMAIAGVAEAAWRVRADRRIAAAAALVVAVLAGLRASSVHAIPPQHTSPRVLEWAATGSYLRSRFPHATVAVVPIGAIGYYSGLPILDLVGLTEPAIAREGRSVPPELLTRQWIGHERNFTEYVLAQAPEVIVTTMVRAEPWMTLAEARAGFYSDWLLLQEIRAGRAPYHVHDAEITPGRHLLMFVRDDTSERARAAGSGPAPRAP